MSAACLYDCHLRHERLAPRHHKFGYGLFMLYFDLDELDSLSRFWPLSVNRPNLFSFFECDHLKEENSRAHNLPLSARIRELAREKGVDRPVASVTLLTLPRIFNYVFNPVSFYFLFDENKNAIACVVEVSNTFKEMKTYLIKAREGEVLSLTTPKFFYVSPFGELADSFEFVVPVPADRLAITINTVRVKSGAHVEASQTQKIMCANLSGAAKPLTASSLVFNLFRYPLLTFKIMAMIHWQAFLLFLKKVPFHAKDEAPNLQIDVFNRRKEKANG